MVFGSLFGLAVFVVAGGNALVCGVLLAGGCRSRAMVRPGRSEASASAGRPEVTCRVPFAATRLDVAAEVRLALAAMSQEAKDRLVALDKAIAPELAVHADAEALRQVLVLLVGHAVRQAHEQVLVSAAVLGGRVQIAVTDDGPGEAPDGQQAMLRQAMELVALQGGTLGIEAWPGQGSTVAVRLPEAVALRQEPEREEVAPRAGCFIANRPAVAAEAPWDS